jgi:hypothetical protein
MACNQLQAPQKQLLYHSKSLPLSRLEQHLFTLALIKSTFSLITLLPHQGLLFPLWGLKLKILGTRSNMYLLNVPIVPIFLSEIDLRKSGAKGRVIYDDPSKYPGKDDVGVFGKL